MPKYLFDREISPVHPWSKALSDASASKVYGEAQITANWRMDHRVSCDRESGLLTHKKFLHPITGDDWLNGIGEYFSAELCLPVPSSPADPWPSYLRHVNQQNEFPKELVSPNNRLFHLASLNAILSRVIRSSNKSMVEISFTQITGKTLPVDNKNTKAFAAEIVTEIQSRGEDACRTFIASLSEALDEKEPHWWAVFDYELKEIDTKTDWTPFASKLGLGHLQKDDWLIAWHYPVRKAGKLYRPTVVEANTNPYHYPSPPQCSYGITMPLNEAEAGVCELLHPPLKGEDCRKYCLGKFGQVQSSITGVEEHKKPLNEWLANRRKSHGDSLIRNYQRPFTKDWLTKHGVSK